MIPRFFIDRPIFAAVLSIVITLAGGIALVNLPIAQYPQISPPTVSVTCNYPGASAQVVSESVATPIEQQVNGVENMMYMSSACTNDGSYTLTVTFKHGVNLNMAQVLVQNRVSLALPLLPDVIKQTGVTTKKRAPDILLVIAINSPDSRYDQLYLSNYALMRVRDELARLPGVSDITMLGQRDYSMRIWLDPDRLAERYITAGDVARALREQNMQVATGQLGQPPIPPGQETQVTLSTLGRLVTVDQFRDVVIKATRDGRLTRIRDVARVELGAKNQDVSTKVNGRPCASLAIFQLPDANALETAQIIKDKMKVLAQDFPEGIGYEIRYDTTPFISESIGEVFKTLQEAIILVAVVVLLFLQNWRSSLIPLVAVPVAIIGTFAVMVALGFSLNNLTLFGLVLAIGIVVDDAIVVVEAVEHHIEHGMAPRDATIRAMDEVAGPVIAIGLVLSAVFVPCAFITGIVGQFFRQFALTIATSTLISTFNSLTLSPALAALLLKPKEEQGREVLPWFAYAGLGGWLGWLYLGGLVGRVLNHTAQAALTVPGVLHPADQARLIGAGAGLVLGWIAARPLDWLIGGFFRLFNAGFRLTTRVYTRAVGMLLRVSVLVMLVYGGLLYLTYWGFSVTPKGFIPSQDMGYLLVNVQLPDAASAERTREVMDRMEQIARKIPGIRFTQTISGQSFLLSAFGSNFGSMFLILDDFSKRPDPVGARIWRWMDSREIPSRQRVRNWFVTSRGPVSSGWSLAELAEKKLGLQRPKVPELNSDAIANKLRAAYAAQVPEAVVTVLPPPPVRGVGRAGGFMIMIEDRGDNGPRALQEQTEGLVLAGIDHRLGPPPSPNTNPKEDKRPKAFAFLSSVFRANVPQLDVRVNRAECRKKGVALQDFFDTLRIYLGSLYVNDFNLFGRTWQVVVQADAKFRNEAEEVKRLKVRNAVGTMVPVGTLAEVKEVPGPLILTRYNMYPAAQINGNAAPGISSRQAIDMMEGLANDPERGLSPSFAYEWTELAYLELQAGNTAMYVFGFAVVMVFLVLAAQYESWSLPLAIILVVPMCLLGGVAGVSLGGRDINIFTQIGFVVLVGLASKNAILIVEFAKMKRDAGEPRRQATLEACQLRLRPIVMTSMAFILGVLPLIVSHGAGAEMRQTLGLTVFSGMIGVTAFGLLLTPVFFFAIDWLGHFQVFHSVWLNRISAVVLWTVVCIGCPPLVLVLLWQLARRFRRPAALAGDADKPVSPADPLE